MSDSYTFILSSNQDGTIAFDASSGDAFDTPIIPPIDVVDASDWEIVPVKLISWYTSPNISAVRGNNLFQYTIPAPNAGTHLLTIPDGLYDLVDLERTIADELVSKGHGTIVAPIFSFAGLAGEQRIIITIVGVGYEIDFSIANTIRDMLGFASNTYGALPAGAGVTTAASTVHKATLIADMSQGLESYVVHASIVGDSYLGGVSGDALMLLSLSAGNPNTQLTEINFLDKAGLSLNSGRISRINVYLTDQSGNRITLNNNTYTVSFILRRKRNREVTNLVQFT